MKTVTFNPQNIASNFNNQKHDCHARPEMTSGFSHKRNLGLLNVARRHSFKDSKIGNNVCDGINKMITFVKIISQLS